MIVGEQGVFFGSRVIQMQLPEPIPTLEIRYTTDGSIPTPQSNLYLGPVTLASTAMLQARTFDSKPEPTVRSEQYGGQRHSLPWIQICNRSPPICL